MKWFAVLYLWISLGFLYAQECWSEEELTKHSVAELDDTIIFSIKDALDCSPIVRAEVKFGKMLLHTDEEGELKMPIVLVENLKKISFRVEKSKYITLDRELSVQLGTIRENKFLLTPE